MTPLVSRRAVLLGAAGGVLAACSSGSSERRPHRGAATAAEALRSDGGVRLPVVLAVHPVTAIGRTATRAELEAVHSGGAATWQGLRVVRGPGAVAEVAAAGDAVAVVTADAVVPGTAVVPVVGRDPLTAPADYPVTAAVDAVTAPDPVVTSMWTGDVMLGRRVGAGMAAAGDWELPFSQTASRLAAAGLTVGNLECTLSKEGRATHGGDSFGADPRALAGPRRAGYDILTLGNNHMGDYGPDALVRTVAIARGEGFATTGAGADIAAAREPALATAGGLRFAVLAFCAVGESPEAGPATPGVVWQRMPPITGPLAEGDLAALEASVRAARPTADVLVVVPHWGREYSHRPVAEQYTVGHRLIDAGADAVVGMHQHWVQPIEIYRGRPIVHGLGNFVFDMTFSEQVQQAVVVELVHWGRILKSVRAVPVRIGTGGVPHFLDPTGTEGRGILGTVWS
ncbi:CapA family protein [Kitasatospora arboriphila]|uniref:Capsule synthesis protein CapA domain-containing protein n=1 Tax=Kitasatospora arboriphila TaxID=258052 RepID=A0ABP4DXQ7_9ACTN